MRDRSPDGVGSEAGEAALGPAVKKHTIYVSVPNTKILPRPGWAPDPLMVGIRSPDGLVVGSCTSHPGVLGSIPKREDPGKTGAPGVKVPHGSQAFSPAFTSV